MGFFDLLSFSSSSSSTSTSSSIIPTYDQNQDSINLQIKSLLYLFKRLQIDKLSTLPNKDGTLRYIAKKNELVIDDDPTFNKLDKIYDVDKFLNILLNDEYRILVDFIKNKFRSMCMIVEYPSNLSSRPSSPIKGQSTNNPTMIFPDFKDYKDRNMNGKNFKFVLFPLNDVSIDKIAQILVNSDIYIEHKVSYSKRYSIALESIKSVISINQKRITINEKNQIIRNYLIKLSFHVQLLRIYQEYIKLNSLNPTSPLPPSQQPPSSPTKKPITLRKSMSNLNLNKSSPTLQQNTSPTKLSHKKSINQLSKKPSIPRFKLDELYNPVTSPRKPIPVQNNNNNNYNKPESDSSSSNNDLDQENLRVDIYEKCKMAILDKLNHEKSKLCVQVT